ncbi:hypothetical protein DL98DRAFT_521432 [Cadophora sp. DSE1049]|nr:hypothetical protein DL98DRAFT_521432 [Cadophora sp. DSE1049]
MPATRISHEAGGNAIVRPSSSSNQNPRSHIKIQHLGVGCIVWLPSRGDDDKSIKCIRELCCSNRELQDGGYNHPVVVLKVSPNHFGDVVCSIVKVTSKERDGRFDRLRISQERPTRLPHSDNDGATELYLEEGTMDKQSYVVLEHIFQVPASQLRLCSFRSGSCAYDSRLCAQSYTLLMGRLDLEPEYWVHTMLLRLSIANSPETLRRQSQLRTLGNRDVFATQPLAQQSLRPNHAIPQPIQPLAAANPVFSSPCRCTEESPLLTNNTSFRMPGVYHQQSVSRDLHSDTYSEYRRFEQSGRVPPPEHNSEDSKILDLIVVLAVGSIVWWLWRSK